MTNENATVTIRRARRVDAPAIAGIHVRARQTAHRGIMPGAFLDSLTAAQRTPIWRRFIAGSPSGMATVVAIDTGTGTVPGFCSVCPRRDYGASPEDGEPYTIYVDPDRQGRGTGKALIAAGEAILRGAGFTAAILWMLADISSRYRFYMDFGQRMYNPSPLP